VFGAIVTGRHRHRRAIGSTLRLQQGETTVAVFAAPHQPQQVLRLEHGKDARPRRKRSVDDGRQQFCWRPADLRRGHDTSRRCN
jgi:hypothetical protein